MLANGYVKSGFCFPADEAEVGCCRSAENPGLGFYLECFFVVIYFAQYLLILLHIFPVSFHFVV